MQHKETQSVEIVNFKDLQLSLADQQLHRIPKRRLEIQVHLRLLNQRSELQLWPNELIFQQELILNKSTWKFTNTTEKNLRPLLITIYQFQEIQSSKFCLQPTYLFFLSKIVSMTSLISQIQIKWRIFSNQFSILKMPHPLIVYSLRWSNLMMILSNHQLNQTIKQSLNSSQLKTWVKSIQKLSTLNFL